MTVYDALEKRHVMPRAWEDWSAYRAAWSEWVIRHSKWDHTLLIVGAGACNDYDLAHFARFFRKIVLYDMDEAAMQQALTRLDAEKRGRVECVRGDLLGITPQEYEDFCGTIQNMVNRRGRLTDIRELSQLALVQAQEMYARAAGRREKLVLPQADYVAVSGVHSQINHMLPWIWQAYMQVLEQREEQIFQLAAQENRVIAHEINEKLCVAAGSGLFAAAEAARVGTAGGVEGAYQALEDLKKRTAPDAMHLTDQTHLAWGYDIRQNMIYDMEVLALNR